MTLEILLKSKVTSSTNKVLLLPLLLRWLGVYIYKTHSVFTSFMSSPQATWLPDLLMVRKCFSHFIDDCSPSGRRYLTVDIQIAAIYYLQVSISFALFAYFMFCRIMGLALHVQSLKALFCWNMCFILINIVGHVKLLIVGCPPKNSLLMSMVRRQLLFVIIVPSACTFCLINWTYIYYVVWINDICIISR